MEENGDKVEVSADSIILAAGYKGNQSLYENLWLEIDEVYQIGDNHKTGKIFEYLNGICFQRYWSTLKGLKGAKLQMYTWEIEP